VIAESGIIDADNHYYEAEDCCTRHIPADFASRTVRVVDDGETSRLLAGDRAVSYVNRNILRSVAGPGAMAKFFSGEKTREEVRGNERDPRFVAAFNDRNARLSVMDEQGVDAVIMLPTLGVFFEHDLQGDIPALTATLTAFNRWIEDDWGYGGDGRIFGVPLLSLTDIEWAVQELDRVTALGAKMVNLKMGSVLGRSPADPLFDPFWARVNESGVAVSFHIGNAGYTASFATQWSETPNPAVHAYSPFQMLTCHGDRPIMDTLAALVLHNLFGRFPDVRVVSVENGSSWVSGLLKGMDKAVKMGRSGKLIGGPLTGLPSEIFKKNVYVCPYHEDNIASLADVLGAQRVLLGSDFPHPEGLAAPRDFLPSLAALSEETVALITRANAAELLGVKP
jgi:predicted TIM-barrel fold metal-dependent hydrolase